MRRTLLTIIISTPRIMGEWEVVEKTGFWMRYSSSLGLLKTALEKLGVPSLLRIPRITLGDIGKNT
jgi:hypothetical protein